MIPEMDEMLKLWARDMHGGPGVGGSGSSVLGLLMDCKGEVIRGSRGGSRMLLPWSADIELIINKHLDAQLALVLREHYLCRDPDRLDSQKYRACGCGRSQFYQRLHSAHVAVAGKLLARAV